MNAAGSDVSGTRLVPSAVVFALVGISLLFYAGLAVSVFTPIQRYVFASIVNSGLYFAFCIMLYRSSAVIPGWSAWLFIIAGSAVRLGLIFIGPIASDDMYRYIWDGKVQANGFDPYRYAPLDPALNGLHSDMIPGLVNYPDMKTLYPPVAEWIFRLTYLAFGESIIGFKVPLLCAEIVSLFLLRSILRSQKLPLSWIALYALCPLPILQFMVDGHLDALGLPFLLAFVLLWLRAKPLTALGSLGISAAIKLVPLIFIPFAFRALHGWKKVLSIGIPLGILGLAYLPSIAGGGSPFEALGIFSARWEFNGSVFHLLYPLFQDNEKVHIACTLLFLAWAAICYFRNLEFVDSLMLMLFGFFILAPTVHPWYLTWLAVLLPLRFRWSAIAFVALVSLSTIVIIDYKLAGIWKESGTILWVEYGILAAVTLWEYLRNRRPAGTLHKTS